MVNKLKFARLEFVDTATGQRVTPVYPRGPGDGSAPTGAYVADFRGQTIEVDEEDLAGGEGQHPRTMRWRVDLDGPVDYEKIARAQAEKARQPSEAPKAPKARETFKTAKDAGKMFYRENELFYDHVRDPAEGLREWMDGVEVRVGRSLSSIRLNQAPAGRRILEARPPANLIVLALTYVFGQSKGRRWDGVDWNEIERMGEALEPHYEPLGAAEAATPGLYWRPVFGPLGLADLEEMSPTQREDLLLVEGAQEVADALEGLEAAYDLKRDCVPKSDRPIVERRIAEWQVWTRRPRLIPAYACEPDDTTGGYTCDYPAVAAELREMTAACEKGYDADWSTVLSREGRTGYPDTSQGADDPEDVGGAEALAQAVDQAIDVEGYRQLAEGGKAFGAPASRIVNEQVDEDGTIYRQELVKCGSRDPVTREPWCWCMKGPANIGHGPYWYAYYKDQFGTRRSKYMGEEFKKLVGEDLD